jgi:DNA-binding NtrC family response regulator
MSRILIIDDEIHIRKLYHTSFAADGYEVETCGTPDEALAKINSFRPDVIVLDIELGEDSGLDLLKQIRQAQPAAAVVLNTAYNTYKSDFQTWLADAYVVKTSDLTPLKETVLELIVRPKDEQSI